MAAVLVNEQVRLTAVELHADLIVGRNIGYAGVLGNDGRAAGEAHRSACDHPSARRNARHYVSPCPTGQMSSDLGANAQLEDVLDEGNDAASMRVVTIAPSGSRADTKPFGPSLSSTDEKFHGRRADEARDKRSRGPRIDFHRRADLLGSCGCSSRRCDAPASSRRLDRA